MAIDDDIRPQLERLRRDYEDLRREIRAIAAARHDVRGVGGSRRRGVLASAGTTAESLLKLIYRRQGKDRGGKPADKLMLEELSVALRDQLPEATLAHLKTVQTWRNIGSHDKGDIGAVDDTTLEGVNTALNRIFVWFFADYLDGAFAEFAQFEAHEPTSTAGEDDAKLAEWRELLWWAARGGRAPNMLDQKTLDAVQKRHGLAQEKTSALRLAFQRDEAMLRQILAEALEDGVVDGHEPEGIEQARLDACVSVKEAETIAAALLVGWTGPCPHGPAWLARAADGTRIAEEARVADDAALKVAEAQRTAADAQRKADEEADARKKADEAEAVAEAAREDAERQRIAAEGKRKADEAADARRMADEAKAVAEAARKDAELQRIAAEAKQKADEEADARKRADEAKTAAEAARKEAERQRSAAEAKRKAAEEADARKKADEAKAAAESARKEAERQRIAAEAKRKAAAEADARKKVIEGRVAAETARRAPGPLSNPFARNPPESKPDRSLALQPPPFAPSRNPFDVSSEDEAQEDVAGASVSALLARIETSDDDGERVVLLRDVAIIYEEELDDHDNAFEALQVAWSFDFTDPETIAQLERLVVAAHRWTELLRSANEGLAAETTSAQAKIAICLCCAKWCSTRLERPADAIRYCQTVLKLDATNLPAVRQMCSLCRQTEQWAMLATMLSRRVELATDDDERLSAYIQLGELTEYRLGVPLLTVEHFRNALKLAASDWRPFEIALIQMLKRVAGKERIELEWNLWHCLGVAYRDRIRNQAQAIEAFKRASSLRPDDDAGHEVLAELYALVPARIQEAVHEFHYLLNRDPYRVDRYRALYKLYFDARAYDKAWCIASTLVFLKKADVEQRSFYEGYRESAALTARRAGFFVSDDLEIARRMLREAPRTSSWFRQSQDVTPEDKIIELVLFSISEQYFRLREALGIQIQIG